MALDSLNGGLMTVIFFCGLVLSAGIIALLLATKIAWRIAMDVPNERSLHHQPIPRIGGWAIVPAGLVLATVFGAPDILTVCIIGVLFFVSYGDDRFSLPILVRMPIHVAAAALWLSQGPATLPVLTAFLAGCGIVWITNLFNFMDGSDGLAGGMALFAFATFGAVAGAAGVTPLAIWSIALAGAAAGFLVFNFNPARVFLGDAGSVTLGFLAGAFGIWGWAAGAWPFWFPFLVAAPFFLDATVTLFRRVLRREAFWRAHREHYYQRLIRSGWSHRRTACCAYLLMAASALLAVAMLGWSIPMQYAGLVTAGVVYFYLGRGVDRRWAAYKGSASNSAGAPTTGPETAADVTRHSVTEPRSELVATRARPAPTGRVHTLQEHVTARYDQPAFQEADVNRS